MATVSVLQEDRRVALACSCGATQGTLCESMMMALQGVLQREDWRLFFDKALRGERLREEAALYGLEQEPDLDSYFEPVFHQKLSIRPRQPSLTPVTPRSMQHLKEHIAAIPDASLSGLPAGHTMIVVLRQHKFYRHLVAGLYSAPVTKEGKPKNPLTPVAPLELLWQQEEADYIKFYTAVHKFQQHKEGGRTTADLAALRALIRNPAGYAFHRHDPSVSDNISAASILPVKVAPLAGTIGLTIEKLEQFYHISGELRHKGIVHPLKDITLRFGFFLEANDTLYLPGQPEALTLAELLLQQQGRMTIHASRFIAFKKQVLDPLSDKIRIDYRFIRPATPTQLQEQGFNSQRQRIIYLSDSGDHVLIIPVLQYNDVEIPVRSKRQIHAEDSRGQTFLVARDEAAELEFTALVLRQHPLLNEQLDNELYYFYLHKERFLDENWFPDAFEVWRSNNILILGFNELENNKRSPYKARIDIKVLSGINWFNAVVGVRYGHQKASLKNIYKAIRNRNRYVTLDDGTLGLLPEEWIDRFSAYFNAGEISDDDTIHIPKVNFMAVEQLYEAGMLDETTLKELAHYHQKLDQLAMHNDKNVVPAGLRGTLRPYQQQGLNWLAGLGELGFGGCLADDMGLGKSVQVLALLLYRQEKNIPGPSLLVVPTTLLFNWREEAARFAPSLNILSLYGPERPRHCRDFGQYDVVLTSYNTLLSDVAFLKEYEFDYVILDESQQIKNPETQRYKAVRLLRARNRLAVTGTPVENNTFDLYSQLSFACPGLLGSKQHFRDIYSVPIDTFNVSKRAQELQERIRPFVLRRTKDQVAPELPDKTEMVLYCTMDEDQRNIYDAYEKEFREYISATDKETLERNPMHVLKGLTKLRQICNSPRLLGREDLTGHSSAKMTVLMEQLGTKAQQHKILVFSQFVSMLQLVAEALREQGIGYALLTGSTRDREAEVASFRQDAATRIFLISLKAGGTGLNLTEADYVYIVDPWWNPAAENQAIDRAHRIGQDKKVIAIRLICPGTVEEKIVRMQETKKALAQELIRADNTAGKIPDKDTLLSLLQ